MRDDNLTAEQIQENLGAKDSRVFGLVSDTPIYRVIRAEHLIGMVSNCNNTLLHISAWEDPFEAFLLQQEVHDAHHNPVDISTFYENVYGQCWSLNDKETDATWRIYSPEKDGILVKTTFGKLWDGFYNPRFKSAPFSFAIGKVSYHDEIDIVSTFNGYHFSDILDDQLVKITKSLLIKRREFEYENELRIIFHNCDKMAYFISPEGKKLLSYKIEPQSFIDDLVADPRMPDTVFNHLKSTLISAGFHIKKSALYQLQNLQLQW